MSTWYQPHTRHGAAELRISSFDLSPKAVIYPCFHTHLCPDSVPPMPTVAEGLSLPASKAEPGGYALKKALGSRRCLVSGKCGWRE